jgi:hypothetical protein
MFALPMDAKFARADDRGGGMRNPATSMVLTESLGIGRARQIERV